MNITSADIRTKMQALDESLVDLEVQFENLSVALLVGDGDAAQKIAEVQQRIDRLGVERKILGKGLARAYALEKEAHEKDIAARRGSVIATARKSFTDILTKCEKLDEMREAYLALAAEVGRLEMEAKSSLRSVRAMPEVPMVGFNGLQERAKLLMNVDGAGKLMFMSDQRGLAEAARLGWAFLFEEEPEEQEAA